MLVGGGCYGCRSACWSAAVCAVVTGGGGAVGNVKGACVTWQHWDQAACSWRLAGPHSPHPTPTPTPGPRTCGRPDVRSEEHPRRMHLLYAPPLFTTITHPAPCLPNYPPESRLQKGTPAACTASLSPPLPTPPPSHPDLGQPRHEVQAPGGHPRSMHRLYCAVHVCDVVAPPAQQQELSLEGLFCRGGVGGVGPVQ